MIKRYIELDISIASMAKLVNCHPQTVKRYILDKKLVMPEHLDVVVDEKHSHRPVKVMA